MPDYDSIAATGRSIVRLLNHCFSETQTSGAEPHPVFNNTKATLIRTEDFQPGTVNEDAATLSPRAVSIFFYRVDVDRTMRAPWSAVGNYEGRAHLPLCLHFLVTPWAENAEYELLLLGRAMQCLEIHPILSGPLLDPIGSWGPGDAIQICVAEITTEEVMRTFDSLPVDFKLSVPYMARVIRLSEQRAQPQPTVERVLAGLRPGIRAAADAPLSRADALTPEEGEG